MARRSGRNADLLAAIEASMETTSQKPAVRKAAGKRKREEPDVSSSSAPVAQPVVEKKARTKAPPKSVKEETVKSKQVRSFSLVSFFTLPSLCSRPNLLPLPRSHQPSEISAWMYVRFTGTLRQGKSNKKALPVSAARKSDSTDANAAPMDTSDDESASAMATSALVSLAQPVIERQSAAAAVPDNVAPASTVKSAPDKSDKKPAQKDDSDGKDAKDASEEQGADDDNDGESQDEKSDEDEDMESAEEKADRESEEAESDALRREKLFSAGLRKGAMPTAKAIEDAKQRFALLISFVVPFSLRDVLMTERRRIEPCGTPRRRREPRARCSSRGTCARSHFR